jgi:polyphosphate kinase
LRSGLLEKISNEITNAKAGKPAGIQMKLNSLLDEEFVEALYEASAAGVKIDLIIRGICAIRPGIKGLSENIKVRSILGRFLEHSRVYHFVNGGEDEYWIGSSDLMHRNLDRRVESLVRIERPAHKSSLQELIDLSISEETASWHQEEDKWTHHSKNSAGEPLQDLQNLYIKRYKKAH